MTGKRKLIKAAGTARNLKGRPKAIRRSPDAALVFASPGSAECREAISHIIAAVGKKPDDETLLAADIEQAYINYEIECEVEDADLAKTRKLLERICKGLESATKLIDSNPFIKRVARPYDLPGLLKALRNTELWQGMRLREERLHPKPKELRQPNAIETLAGETLPLVYERRFDSDITFNRDDDENVKGPVIDFIEATMTVLGLHYSRGSIRPQFLIQVCAIATGGELGKI
jgi:hypothetical protein